MGGELHCSKWDMVGFRFVISSGFVACSVIVL